MFRLDIPSYGCKGVIHPDMVYFPEGYLGYKYWLFYTRNIPATMEAPCLVRGNDGNVFTDAGIKNPLISTDDKDTPDWSNDHIADPDVIFHDGKFYMFYTGCSGTVVHPTTMLEHPSWSVVVTKNETFTYKVSKQKYGSILGLGSVCMAWSDDGNTWIKADRPVLSCGFEPTVVKVDNEFYMWFSVKDEDKKTIWMSKSNTLFEWSSPIKALSPTEEYENKCFGHPEVVYHNGLFEMYVLGGRGDSGIKTYLERLVSDDGVNWRDKSIIFKHNGIHPYRTTSFYEGDKRRLYMSYLEKLIPFIGVYE